MDNTNFIYVSSVMHRDSSYGKIDWDGLEQHLSNERNNIIVTHHSLHSEWDNGHKESSLREAGKYFDSGFSSHTMCYFLHGDVHKENIYKVNDNKLVISVAPLFSELPDINKQFHFINLENGYIEKIIKCVYEGDHNSFRPIEIFPLRKPILLLNKEKYLYPNNYIERKVAPFNTILEGSLALYYNINKQKNLLDICLDEKHIVLLGEAGCGKSFELKYLSAELSQKDLGFYPVYIQLNTYTNENIDNLIPKKYSDIDMPQLFIIFDGYDEIETANLNNFARKINAFVNQYPDTPIIISARNNFYKFIDDDGQGGTFYKFKEYGLCPIKQDSIREYVNSQSINFDQFWKGLHKTSLHELVQNPFYLIELVRLYSIKSSFPNRSELMNQIILNRFIKDERKYTTTTNIEDIEYELITLLKRLAFSMQCMQKTYLTNLDYQILFTEHEREILRYSGVWSKQANNNWTFDHNNFREYLAAENLAEQSWEAIREIISYSNKPISIKESWMNILSFFALIYTESDLLNWLQEVAPAILIKFEASRINLDSRKKIFINIFNEYKSKNMWLSIHIDTTELALFGQSLNTLEFLLKEVEKPTHFRSQSNALTLLREFGNLFDQEEAVKKVLLSCCGDSNTRSYEKKYAIIALCDLKLNSKDTTMLLFKILGNSNNSEIRYGLYTYLLKSNLQEEYIDYLLNGILLDRQNRDGDLSCAFILQEALKQINSVNAIQKTFAFFSNKDKNLRFDDNIIQIWVQRAANFYLNGEKNIFEEICRNFVEASEKFNNPILAEIKLFFVKTNTQPLAFKHILATDFKDFYSKLFILEDIADSQCHQLFLDKYKNNELQDNSLFVEFVKRRNVEQPLYNECISAVFDKEGIVIKKPQQVNYEQKRIDGRQNYFNVMFNKELFANLINELLEFFGDSEITYDRLNPEFGDSNRLDRRQDIQSVVFDLGNCNFEDKLVKNFLQHVCWETYSINKIYRILCENPKHLHITQMQKEYIEAYCRKNILTIDFNNSVTYKEDGWSFPWTVIYVSFFSNYFDFKYDKKVYLEMLILPPFLINKNNTIENDVFPNYLTKHLSQPEISSRVLQNLENLELKKDAATTHLNYCREHKLPYGIDLAEKICKNPNLDGWDKRPAFEYLLQRKGPQYIYSHFLPTADDSLLRIIVEKLMQDQHPRLEECLINRNKASKDNLLYLSSLITMNSKYGIQKYLDLANEQNQIPDYSEEDNIASITQQIRYIKNINLLPEIMKLVLLLFTPDFKDHQHFGLYNSLLEALKNISADNFEEVRDALESTIQMKSDNLELHAFCNGLLEEIKIQYNKQRDIPLTVKEVQQYLSKL